MFLLSSDAIFVDVYKRQDTRPHAGCPRTLSVPVKNPAYYKYDGGRFLYNETEVLSNDKEISLKMCIRDR